MDYLKIANSPLMWLAVLPAVLLTFVQAALFTKRAMKTGPKIGLTKEQMKNAVTASAAASIGPALVIAIGCLALISAIGGPMAWMRLAYIGSVGFELMAANFGAEAAGAVLGGEGMDLSVFSVCCFTMCISCLGWIIMTGLFTHKLGAISDKISHGSATRVAVLSAGGAIGAYAHLVFDKILPASGASADGGNIIASVVSFLITAVLTIYGKKAQKAWCSKWGMTIAMFAGMIATGILI